MRFLKKKVLKAQEKSAEMEDSSDSETHGILSKKIFKNDKTITTSNLSKENLPKTHITKTSYEALCIKNLAKNYGRAICNFILSSLCDPYLLPEVEKKQVNLKNFKNYIKDKKNTLDGVEDFRELLLIKGNETPAVQNYKALFQLLGIIFVKYFSVNWIFSGKLSYKQVYLNYRFKILRRIKNPELFTYIR